MAFLEDMHCPPTPDRVGPIQTTLHVDLHRPLICINGAKEETPEVALEMVRQLNMDPRSERFDWCRGVLCTSVFSRFTIIERCARERVSTVIRHRERRHREGSARVPSGRAGWTQIGDPLFGVGCHSCLPHTRTERQILAMDALAVRKRREGTCPELVGHKSSTVGWLEVGGWWSARPTRSYDSLQNQNAQSGKVVLEVGALLACASARAFAASLLHLRSCALSPGHEDGIARQNDRANCRFVVWSRSSGVVKQHGTNKLTLGLNATKPNTVESCVGLSDKNKKWAKQILRTQDGQPFTNKGTRVGEGLSISVKLNTMFETVLTECVLVCGRSAMDAATLGCRHAQEAQHKLQENANVGLLWDPESNRAALFASTFARTSTKHPDVYVTLHMSCTSFSKDRKNYKFLDSTNKDDKQTEECHQARCANQPAKSNTTPLRNCLVCHFCAAILPGIALKQIREDRCLTSCVAPLRT